MTIIQTTPLKTYGISGPASAVNNEVPVFDGTTGKKIKAGTGLIITADLAQATDKALLLSGTSGGTPVSGAGTRMMWIPEKNAFRAGKINGTHWDNANIGNPSVAFGYNGIASGEASSHFGYAGIASGFSSIHFGMIGIVSGNSAAHFGRGGNVDGDYSTHFGMMGETHGDFTTHFGYGGLVSGNYAVHLGCCGKAEGDYSLVCGQFMQLSAAADRSFAWGYSNFPVALTQPDTFYVFPAGIPGKVAIGTTIPAASAVVDITSTMGALLLPRMTTAQRNALTAVNGMLLYNSTLNKLQGYENGAWADLI